MLSKMMSEEDHVYYFGYKGNGRTTDSLRSMVGSNNIMNILWTAPILIFGG